jgi:hypothetical protein
MNTGMLGLRYNLFARTSSRLEARPTSASSTTAGQVNLRAGPQFHESADLFGAQFSLHRWDHFRSFSIILR